MARFAFDRALLRDAVLAPMEDVTDPVFRAICRARGASLCVTEFVHAEHLRDGDDVVARKLDLTRDEGPTAIQIYGADPEALVSAARRADMANPSYVDINCGCWVPRVVHRGAGAAWLRDPDAMIAMSERVVKACSRPVTVKTRIGWGPESEMPIVDLARRLEDVGVAAITVHCRTAQMGHEGKADWRWAARARAAVSIPVIVNGDINSAGLARKALAETGCDGVMIGRRAIEHPWIFRETRSLLESGAAVRAPSVAERFAACREHVDRAVEHYGARAGMRRARRFFRGYLRGLPGGLGSWQREVDTLGTASERGALDEAIDAFEALATRPREAQSSAPGEWSP